MKINSFFKSAFSTPRVLIAGIFFCISAIFALSALTDRLSPGPGRNYALTRSMSMVPLNETLGHSYWNEIMSATARAIPAVNGSDSVSHFFAMRAAGGHARGLNSVAQSQTSAPLVSIAVSPAVSIPLKNLPATNAFSAWVEQPEPRSPSNRFPQMPRSPQETDPVLQSSVATAAMPSVNASFEGMNISSACGNCLPPDPNGAIGPNHYVQMVNSSIAVYSRAGATLMSPKPINGLWSVTPNSECFANNNGDPIVLYDQLADRWFVSQFVASAAPNYAQCVAVSQTNDPTGAYFLYEFDEAPDVFNDYPHIGVWPDGYYMSTNQFPDATTGTVAAGAWVFERPKMILGQPARYVFFDETPLANCTPGGVECVYTPFGQLPATLDGKTPPPPGTPNYFLEVDDTNTPETPPAVGVHDELHVWKFHVDWNNPANSSFGVGSTMPAARPGFAGQYAGNAGQPDFILPVADYLASACQIENGPDDCSPEKVSPPQPAQYLDVLGDRLMFRFTYRNFGDHESFVVNHTADTPADSSTTGRNGVRWYELRNLSTSPVVYQQGTFAPLQDPTNPLWRWMGSAAMDNSGDIAIGYSASGPNYFPSLHYAGRLASDPINDLTQGEAVLFAGLGIEANTGIYPFRNRWGDYSAITVDPTDDCTFWYTNEYLAPNAPTDILPVDWRTRVASFRFPQCVSPTSVSILSVVSRKIHGSAGPFDIDLPLTGGGIESRSGGPNGNHQLVVTFAAPVSFSDATTTCGSVVDATPSGNQVTINLTGVPNASRCAVTLDGVTDGTSTAGAARLPVNFLAGDTTADGRVNSADVSLTQSQTGQVVGQDNFREDVTVDGRINSADVSFVQMKSGTALP